MIKEYWEKYKSEFKKCIEDLKHKDTFYKQIPNLLTISRPIGMIPANILFFTGNITSAVVLTGLLLLTDFFDGKLARKWNVQSKFGADLDAVGDKIMFLGMSLPLIVSNPLMLINVLLEGAIALVNVMGRVKGLDTETVFAGKIKTWILSITLVIGYLVQFFNVPISILYTLIPITAVSQGYTLIEYIKKNKRMQKEKNNEIKEEKDIISDDLVLTNNETLIDQLKREREFVLATQLSSKVYTGKKRARIMLQERKNNN